MLTALFVGCKQKNDQKMNTESMVITGAKSDKTDTEELKALHNFYKAFNGRDMNLMKSVWLNSPEASMNNPLGGIMRNWNEIETVYDKIFNGKATVHVAFYDFTIHQTDDMFLATGRERGSFKTEDDTISLAIRTSRVFIKHQNNWKQLQHHGSIDNPELLKKYQKLVRK